MPGLHWPELIVILLIAALLFGARRLPEMGSAVGKTIREFQKSMREVADNVNTTRAVTPPEAERQQLADTSTPPPTLPAPSAAAPAETARSASE